VTARSDARAHLRKAREFLASAEMSLEAGMTNAAASSAVSAGINAKDVICLALTGTTGKADDHAAAVAELRRAGPGTATLGTTLGRLLKLKNRSQYQAVDVSRADAAKAVAWAAVLVDGAADILAG
jgi:hypothetical protein